MRRTSPWIVQRQDIHSSQMELTGDYLQPGIQTFRGAEPGCRCMLNLALRIRDIAVGCKRLCFGIANLSVRIPSVLGAEMRLARLVSSLHIPFIISCRPVGHDWWNSASRLLILHMVRFVAWFRGSLTRIKLFRAWLWGFNLLETLQRQAK